jgi:sugar lactone lactonase YvrE
LFFLENLFSLKNLQDNTKWKQFGLTIAGGNREGNQLNQLASPLGIYVNDNNQTIYISDYDNHRIVQWKIGAQTGQFVVAGGNGKGNRIDQLNNPTDLVFDQKNDSLIICDQGNRRIVRWPRRKRTNQQIIISNIDGWGLAMDNNGDLYVSDYMKNEVKRWREGETNGTIVAGGHGKGKNLNQLNTPRYIFVDEDYSVYVSDNENHRVMKWMKDAREGIVVAGGQGPGESLRQLYHPNGVTVDHSGNIYVADLANHRIMRWLKDAKEGSIIVGGNGKGQKLNQLNYPMGVSFNLEGNFYVVDQRNHRVQKFDVDFN